MKPKVLAGVIAAIIIIGAGVIYWTSSQSNDVSLEGDTIGTQPGTTTADNPSTVNDQQQAPTQPTRNSVVTTTQTAGSNIIIDEVSFTTPGYVVIHENINGKPGKIIAQSGLISGTRHDLVIRLTTKAGMSYIAMLHTDDGDGKFNATKDQPTLGANNQPVTIQFNISK
jgi:hypothetical protein